jgi:hypothetical protein
VTLDNFFFTFNGLCEYVMSMNSTPSTPMLQVQARTGLALLPGTDSVTNATVFTGFAVKFGNNEASVAVLLNDRQLGDPEIFVNSRSLGRLRLNVTSQSPMRIENYELTAAGDSVLISDSDSGVAINVSVSINFLQSALQLPRQFSARVKGLLGNFNGNASDDLELRNGSVLHANASERHIFEFGQSWRLQQDDLSLFPYSDGLTREHFCDPAFTPVFVTDFRHQLPQMFLNNASLFLQANSVSQSPG